VRVCGGRKLFSLFFIQPVTTLLIAAAVRHRCSLGAVAASVEEGERCCLCEVEDVLGENDIEHQ
jgi:hypothetical protein